MCSRAGALSSSQLLPTGITGGPVLAFPCHDVPCLLCVDILWRIFTSIFKRIFIGNFQILSESRLIWSQKRSNCSLFFSKSLSKIRLIISP